MTTDYTEWMRLQACRDMPFATPLDHDALVLLHRDFEAAKAKGFTHASFLDAVWAIRDLRAVDTSATRAVPRVCCMTEDGRLSLTTRRLQ